MKGVHYKMFIQKSINNAHCIVQLLFQRKIKIIHFYTISLKCSPNDHKSFMFKYHFFCVLAYTGNLKSTASSPPPPPPTHCLQLMQKGQMFPIKP